MIFRKIHSSEAGFLKEMLYTSLFVPKGRPPYPRSVLELPELAKYYMNWGSLPHDLAVVAVASNELAGAAWGRAYQPPNTGFGFVAVDVPEIGIAVKPDFRNQGVGTQLLQTLFHLYITQGVKSTSLSVDRNNPARSLYDRFGFVVVSENDQDFIMQKKLAHR